MEENPRRREHQETRSLIYRFNLIAFGLPFVALCLVLGYIFFFDVQLERRDWSRIVFVLWIGGLFGLGYAFFRLLLGERTIPTPQGPVPVYRKTMADWENRSTRNIVWDFVAYLLVVPGLALGLVWLANELIPLQMRHADWKNAILCVWIGVLLALIIPTRRAIRSRMGS